MQGQEGYPASLSKADGALLGDQWDAHGSPPEFEWPCCRSVPLPHDLEPLTPVMAKSQIKAGGPTRGRLRVRKMGMGSGARVVRAQAAKKKKRG